MNRLTSHGQATRSTLMSLRVIHFMFASRSPGICKLNGKTVLVELQRVCRNQARKSLTCSVDHIQIAIRTIIPAQTNVCAGGLIVGGVHLQQCRERQKSGKRVVCLKAAEDDREIPGSWQKVSSRGGRR